MSEYLIAPAKPPLPVPSNFPFQPEFGIHTSKRMFESAAGLMTPVTLQKAGRLTTGLPPGGVGLPAGTGTALVMDASGSVRWASASQGVAADAGVATAMQAKRAKTARTMEGPPVRLIILCSHRIPASDPGGIALDISMSRYAPVPGSPSLGEVLVIGRQVRARLHLETDDMLGQHRNGVPDAGLNIHAACIAAQHENVGDSPGVVERVEPEFALQHQERL